MTAEKITVILLSAIVIGLSLGASLGILVKHKGECPDKNHCFVYKTAEWLGL